MSILEKVFPRINDWALAVMEDERHSLVSLARGDVLELGFGTGLNLKHYQGIQSLTAIEPSDAMRHRGTERAENVPFPVHIHKGFAEELPFPDASFDTVVATFVLCSVRDPGKAIREVGRVLRPGGHFVALEHVRSEKPSLAMWQDRVTPLWKIALGGCHPNRDLTGLPEKVAGLEPVRFERFMAQQPALVAPHIRGVWEKAT